MAALRPADQVVLVALFGFRHYLYPYWPQDQMGDVYGIGAALCLIFLLMNTGLWWGIKAWAMGEELLTAGCTAAWLAWPEWFTHAFADERCSQAVGFKVGSVGIVFLALITYHVYCITEQVTKHNEQSDNE